MHPTTKHELRKLYREKRITLLPDQFQRLNEQLLTQLQEVDFGPFSTIHLFLPIEGNREPDTHAIADWLRQRYPHVRLVLSRSDKATYRMQHVVWDEDTKLSNNHWGIPEPEGGVSVLPEELDIVFVPLLAFDIHGNRVGYGKGFYDRFLSACRPDVLKVGLSLFEPTGTILDADQYDVPLSMCITPHSIWRF
ncbi:5-formyltetrahydrofolate cyclo-ligase [Parapedobacter sp. DT-150]|uniref:5-formyltetrahydrofolate cyclo-ligase n=1 Tax=Parapedobacter sp. DT-150 TaxID=3396162 RepID=UPI003F19D26E